MMRKVEEVYLELYRRLEELTEDCREAERQVREASVRNQVLFKQLETEIAARQQEVAEKMNRVNVFINFAREHTQHCEMAQRAAQYDTVLLNRLMVLIDDRAPEDANARKLYTEATGQLKGLAALKGQMQKQAEERRALLRAKAQPAREAAVQKKEQTLENFRAYFAGTECQNALRQLRDQIMPEDTMSIGLRRASFPVPEEQADLASEVLGDLWDAHTGSILIPVTIGVSEGNVCVAEYTNSTEETVLSGVRDLLLKGIAFTGGDPQQICLFDTIRYNDSALGTLEPLVIGESNLIERVPTSKEEAKKRLDDMISRIQLEDQMAAKNENYRRAVKFYVFHNFPQGYDAAMQEKVRQLCVNAPHGRMNVILTHNCSEDENRFAAKNESYEYLKAFGRRITFAEEGFCTDWDKNGQAVPFTWNQVPVQMPEELLLRAREKRERKDLFGHDYDARVGIREMPSYRKGVRRLTDIPYGVDESGQILTLDFENSNFATFICGAARSGKSTLLHTILTGIFQKNHPDDVEVWLIDFKMTEFSRYIRHMPPHVRYIILDESPELVYDIIDRLTEILQKRQNIFKGVWQKLYDVPKEKYMPAMFVVIDEFSIMSQIIADGVSQHVGRYTI